ncbi:Hypoxanthine-guanine phosphoribosyltransferase [Fulvivirga imtechensis AK7]|uniref:Hypoxanthine phosphoribosyltransferase n=1 Tax=Fulvivirga imtechensis AK7 TaxID=1237149 RepID=L8JPR7_9BACT|nr:hypoxanthine phosphoribosyltransferase [Fulvivirga imtechensis]ELR70956.1 Hypoxanthine-guanine phosphoribosyltransferase [Fulvivirga imtechensis AK7]
MVVKDKEFQKYISSEEIHQKIKILAEQINNDYKDKKPLFIAILNGSFMFAADLFKEVKIPCEISFVKVASYEEMESTGNVKQLIGLNENIFNKDVIIIEDIIDTGRTIAKILEEFRSLGASSVEVVTLLQKPEANRSGEKLKYIGFDIPEKFVVGYGLDYDGLGRNLKDIYQLKE